jgi:adenosylhomocysteine nucleosidase
MLRNALVVLPLQSEFRFFTESLKSFGFSSQASLYGPVPVETFEGLNLICAVGGHGKVQFGIQTQFLLHQLKDISRIFCVGAAGGLHGVSVFDLVLAEHTVEHDYTLRFSPEPPPRFPGCASTRENLKSRAATMDFPFRVHCGLVASGDEDVVSKERAAELHEKTKALAVAWEGAGGARAALFNGKPYLEVRGITDVADTAAPVDFRANLKKAMEHAALFLVKTTL